MQKRCCITDVTCHPDVAVSRAAGGCSHIVGVAVQPLGLLATHQIPIPDLHTLALSVQSTSPQSWPMSKLSGQVHFFLPWSFVQREPGQLCGMRHIYRLPALEDASPLANLATTHGGIIPTSQNVLSV
jgi:hypothetical protein